jgi:hypothetical protein
LFATVSEAVEADDLFLHEGVSYSVAHFNVAMVIFFFLSKSKLVDFK